MKQLNFFRRVMPILALLVLGLGSVWADEVTLGQWTTKPVSGSNSTSLSGNLTDNQSNSWSYELTGSTESKNPSQSVFSGSTYWQIGANGNMTTAVFSTSSISGTITKIEVECAAYNALGDVCVTVGGNDFGTQNQTMAKWNGDSKYAGNRGGTLTFSGSASGTIVVTMAPSTGGRAIYLSYIKVTYTAGSNEGGGNTPTPTALAVPSNLASSNVTTTGATLSWGAVANASSYTVKIGSTEYTNVNTNSYSATGLTAGTQYTWTVKAVGDNTNYTTSAYAANANFTTEAEQGGGEQGGDPEPEPENLTLALALDFSNAGNEWGIPSSRKKTEGTYTCGSYSVTFSASTDGFGIQANGNMVWGKENATLTLPQLPFAVKKIEIVGPASGASGSVTQNIYVGENAASTVQTGANGTKEFVINSNYQAPNTQYVLKITNGNNGQFNAIKFYAAEGDVNIPTYYNVSVSSEIVGGVVLASAKNYVVVGTEISLTSKAALGYDFVSWSVKDASNNDIEVANNKFTMPSSSVTVSATFAAKANTVVYDMTRSLAGQGATVTDDLITFNATQFTMEFDQNGSKNTKVTNNIPDNRKDYTRLYTNNIFRITPQAGYVIKFIQIDLGETPGQTRWTTAENQTNCAVVTGNASNGLPGYVKITPSVQKDAIAIKLTGTTELAGVMVEYGLAPLELAIGNLGYATFAPSKKVLIPEATEDLKVYYITSIDETSVSTSNASGVVPAGTGLIVKATPNTTVEFAVSEEEATALEGNLLVGVTAEDGEAYNSTTHANAYLFSNGTKGVGFYKWMSGTIAKGKAYLNIPPAAQAPQFIRFVENGSSIATSLEDIFNEEATAIKFLKDGVLYIRKGDHIYNVNGQVVK